jgi:tRNA G26 N,N-dimethylase Trm1
VIICRRIWRSYNTDKYTKVYGEVTTEAMKADMVVELFQTMVVVSLNMGNLILEVNILKNKFATGEKKKVMLQEELDKECDF